jgi:predicted AAA+ superfamily ATPase
MRRLAEDFLVKWKNKNNRKPLLLKGARQVGKTWLLKNFGEKHFQRYHHIDFDRDKYQLTPVFNADLNPYTLIRNLSLVLNIKIDLENDLLIFDEIQNVPRALTSLKYFYEQMPELAVCAAGSLLGITLSDESFPVGKVDLYSLRPINIEEFILNYDEGILYDTYLESVKNESISEAIHIRLLDILKEFYIVGGMPDIVDTYLEGKTVDASIFQLIRKKQTDLLKSYHSDFSKHSGKINALHITSVYENVPLQLAQNIDGSVNRFRFKNVVKGKKGFAEIRGPIQWLNNAELIITVHICNRAEIPLRAFCRDNFFKIYLNDIGLLGASLEIPPSAILLGNYGITKGFFIENFVAAELTAVMDTQIYGWNERNSEIEFLIMNDDRLIPVEVKSGTRTKAKSLQQYQKKYNPSLMVVLSEKSFSRPGSLRKDIPIYYAGKLTSLTKLTK